jgi:serine/threonine-protein kinase
MGTPLYMSPEQLRHAPDVDERTDIWSLGAVLYELLVGRPLFSGDTQTEVCRQVFEAGQHSLRLDIPSVPDALWEVIERCLAQRKDERYENVADLGLALLPFAPAAACLHIERARALLGLEHLDFTFDEPIEEIDAEPIDDDGEPEAAMPLVAGKNAGAPAPPGPRRPYWVELALPVLACIVLWIGYRQWQQSGDEAAARSDEAVQTVALALRQSGFGSEPPRADCPVPGNEAPGTSGAPTGAASESSVASGDDGTQGSPPPLAAQHASGVRRASAPAASSAPARSPTPPPATGADARPKAPAAAAPSEAPHGDAPAEPVRRAPKPKPKIETKPQFRLIDDLPPTHIELVPNGSPSAPQPAPSPAPTTP